MAGEAFHFLILVGKVLGRHTRPPIERLSRAKFRHEFGTRRLGIVFTMVRINAVFDERNFPLQITIKHRTLIKLAIYPLETALAERGIGQRQILALALGGRPARPQGRVALRGAMAIIAADFDRRRSLAIKMPVAMHILLEMAVHAMHALLQMDGLHMHRFLELLGIVGIDNLAFGVEQIALAVLLEDRAEIPAMTVIIGKLRILELWIKQRDILQEIRIGPFATDHCTFGVPFKRFMLLSIGGIALLLGPHERRIGFVVPHGVAKIGIHENIGLMHVAIHALRGRNSAREFMLERMPRLILGNRRIDRLCQPCIAILRVRPGIIGITVVRIGHMTRAATRCAEIARIIIRTQKPHEGVIEPRFMNIDERHSDTQPGAGPAHRLAHIGPSRLFQPLNKTERIRNRNFGELGHDIPPAPFEHPENISRRRYFPGR